MDETTMEWLRVKEGLTNFVSIEMAFTEMWLNHKKVDLQSQLLFRSVPELFQPAGGGKRKLYKPRRTAYD